MSSVSLIPGDNRASLRAMVERGETVHSVVCDPPYGLLSIQKRFGKQGSKNARVEGTDGSFARLSGGFVSKTWDGTGIERDPEFWALIYAILRPGGYVFAFSGARTGHWQACAMEMAGFVMHPMHGWVAHSSFPKAHNPARGIDRLLLAKSGVSSVDNSVPKGISGTYKPLTAEAAQWDGWGYGGQAQKTVLEPIYLGQKPFDCKTGPANLLKHGVGAVNIRDCKVPSARAGEAERHPANLILEASEEVAEMFGSSARFYHQFGPDTDPIICHPKAGKVDRAGSEHPTVKPIALMRYLIRHITPPGGVVLDPFAGSGTTGEAAKQEGFDCILMEAEPEYLDFLYQRFDLEDPDILV